MSVRDETTAEPAYEQLAAEQLELERQCAWWNTHHPKDNIADALQGALHRVRVQLRQARQTRNQTGSYVPAPQAADPDDPAEATTGTCRHCAKPIHVTADIWVHDHDKAAWCDEHMETTADPEDLPTA